MHPFTLERPRDLGRRARLPRPGGPQRRAGRIHRRRHRHGAAAAGIRAPARAAGQPRRPSRQPHRGRTAGPAGSAPPPRWRRWRPTPRVVEQFPVISEALLNSASPQVRNQATMGGNLLQRTRCPYFRDVGYAACNKRAPGSGCAAIGGENRWHAVLGTSENCIAANPSDLAVALVALDASVEVRGAGGQRTVPLDRLSPPARRHAAHRDGARTRRGDRRHHGSGQPGGAALALPQGARPRLLRVRGRVGRGGARHGRRPHPAGAGRPGRRRHQALARSPRRGGAQTERTSTRQRFAGRLRSRPRARRGVDTTTSRSNSCSAPSCAPSRPRERAHDHRIHRTACQSRRRPAEGHRPRHLRRRIRGASRGARRHRQQHNRERPHRVDRPHGGGTRSGCRRRP